MRTGPAQRPARVSPAPEGEAVMHRFLTDQATGRLRSGWRLLGFLVLFVVITAIGMITVRTILGGLPRQSALQFSVLAVTATLATSVARRVLDRRSLVSLGLAWDRYALPDLLSGVGNSALLMTAVFLVMWWTGLIEVRGLTWWSADPPGVARFSAQAVPVVLAVLYKLALVAWWEELVFRGYFFQNLAEGTGLLGAVIISSLVFGFGHAFNPDASLRSSILVALVTPQLIYAYLKTGRLWLPIGLHLGWNFFQAPVFGFAASGQDSPSLVAQSPLGPEWLSGGAFGAEGSLLIVPFTLMSCLVIHWWVRATRHPGQAWLGMAPRTGE